MARFSRRRAAFAAIGALALTLLAGGIANAAPASHHEAAQAAARPVRPGDQPPVSVAEAEKARAAMSGASVEALPGTALASFAVVSAGGTLVRGYHAVSALRLGTGMYQVVFDHNVSQGAFLGTIGLTGSVGISPPGQISVVGRSGMANGVFVQTFNSAGVPSDLAFHLGVLD